MLETTLARRSFEIVRGVICVRTRLQNIIPERIQDRYAISTNRCGAWLIAGTFICVGSASPLAHLLAWILMDFEKTEAMRRSGDISASHAHDCLWCQLARLQRRPEALPLEPGLGD